MASTATQVAPPDSPTLSASQLKTLAEVGEERTADAGDVLYRIGDASYPFIAILEGEVAIVDAAGNEIVRHGASSFLGELNLLSGQTVFVTALVTQPLRFIAVERERMRALLFEDGPLSDLVLSAFIARREGFSGSRASESRSSVRVHRKRPGGSLTSPETIGSRSLGATLSAAMILPRPSSRPASTPTASR